MSPIRPSHGQPITLAAAPHPALGWFTDSLAFATYHPEPGE